MNNSLSCKKFPGINEKYTLKKKFQFRISDKHLIEVKNWCCDKPILDSKISLLHHWKEEKKWFIPLW